MKVYVHMRAGMRMAMHLDIDIYIATHASGVRALCERCTATRGIGGMRAIGAIWPIWAVAAIAARERAAEKV